MMIRKKSAAAMKRQAARAAAATILKAIQATSALEAQAVDPETLRLIEDRIVAELLTGPGHRLWAK
jgi:hypothetical protein